ncbi:hypothetical protein Bca52824_052476 [Brassica carinata]|uniref:Uncharacterized protein n=1 Tax=Brassica carinata TaxID=52824 RepID=A0A8X7UMC9_BRACI|nr:hypothetical protein Bca52824_052476 [Brassica carinata]
MCSIFAYGARTTAPSSRVFSLFRSLGDEVSNSIRDALGRRASVRPFFRVGTTRSSLIEMIYTTGSCSIKCQLEQAQLDDNFSTEAILNLKWNLCAAFRDEELYWKQKSRANWLREGDRNTIFFHPTTKQRRARNRVLKLRRTNGTSRDRVLSDSVHFVEPLGLQ